MLCTFFQAGAVKGIDIFERFACLSMMPAMLGYNLSGTFLQSHIVLIPWPHIGCFYADGCA
jgi:hypothetical protein